MVDIPIAENVSPFTALRLGGAPAGYMPDSRDMALPRNIDDPGITDYVAFHEYVHAAQHNMLKEKPTDAFAMTLDKYMSARSRLESAKEHLNRYKSRGRETDLDNAREEYKLFKKRMSAAEASGPAEYSKWKKIGIDVKEFADNEVDMLRKQLE